MGKVFISFLGTGNYSECDYVFRDSSVKTRFIQQALIELCCSGFSREDRICFFLTEEAKIKNWKSGAMPGLQEIAAALKVSAEIITVDIPVGKSEDEIWEIFNKMYEVLQDGDSAIFDITHAFRFLPMLGFAILHYSRYLKNVTVEGIYYGAFEARDPVTQKTPVFELTQFYNLMQWSSAADTFVNYGISDKLQALVRETARFFIGTQGVADAITKVTESMANLRGADIVDGAIFTSCTNKIDKLESTGTFQTAFKPIISKVKEKLEPFKENSSLNFLYAVQWYMDHKMMPQALTMMQEGLLTYLMEKKKYDYRDRKDREAAGSYLRFIADQHNHPEKPWQFSGELQKKYETWKLQPEDFLFGTAAGIYNDICELRNDVNHGGFNQNATSYIRISARAQNLFKELEQVCRTLSAS